MPPGPSRTAIPCEPRPDADRDLIAAVQAGDERRLDEESRQWALHRLTLADSLQIALGGGCGLCDTERGHLCVGCGKCRCFTHETCTRPDNTTGA